MFSSLAKRFIIPAALCITMTGLSPSIASATHNGSWDETAGKRCWWKTPKPQDILPPNATTAMLRDSPLSGSELDAMEHDVEGKIDDERRSVGLQTIDRVDANGVHHGWSSCISAAAAYHSADMIFLNKLNTLIGNPRAQCIPASRVQVDWRLSQSCAVVFSVVIAPLSRGWASGLQRTP